MRQLVDFCSKVIDLLLIIIGNQVQLGIIIYYILTAVNEKHFCICMLGCFCMLVIIENLSGLLTG